VHWSLVPNASSPQRPKCLLEVPSAGDIVRPTWQQYIVGRSFVKLFALCYRTVVLSCPFLSCLSETLMYCDQTVRWIKMPLGTKVGRGPGHIARWGPSSPPLKRGGGSTRPQFSAYVYCGQTVNHLSSSSSSYLRLLLKLSQATLTS